MQTLATTLVLALALGGCATARFRANAPRQIAASSPTSAFETALSTVRGEGYTVTELDPQRGFFRVKSKIDGDMRGHLGLFGHFRLTERVTYLSFQVQSNGMLTIFANGYHVHGTEIHHLVADEIDRLASCIAERTRFASL
jgi:hypothetical protein